MRLPLLFLLPIAGVGASCGTGGTPPDAAPRPVFRVHRAVPGLDYVNVSGDAAQLTVLEQNGQGVALLDYDRDGWLDIFVTNGGTPAGWREGALPGPRLYRNLGGLRFEDVTEAAGLAVPFWGTGVAAADFTGSGFPDLYVAAWGPNRLFRNKGDGTFTEIGRAAGGDDSRWSSSAAAADFNGDGRLDLYVTTYVAFDPDRAPRTEEDGSPCLYRSVEAGCGPWRYQPERDSLYIQQPDGRFLDASLAWGLDATANCRGMGVAAADFDDDGRMDVYVGCDVGPNLYLKNTGRRFTSVGDVMGGALNAAGRHESGMGIALADLFNRGRPDIVVTNFAGETNTYYENTAGRFEDRTAAIGLDPHPEDLGWGVVAADFDLDGWRDVFVANGHIYPQVDELHDRLDQYQQPPRLLLGTGRQRLSERRPEEAFAWATGEAASVRFSLRAVAAGDLTNSGRLDVVAVQHNGPLVIFENMGDRRGRTITLRGPSGHASPHGTRLAAGEWHHVQAPTHGYQSTHDARVLVPPDVGPRVSVRWPDGRCETHALPEPGGSGTIEYGSSPAVPCAVTGSDDRPHKAPVLR